MKVEFKGGKIEIDAGICAVFAGNQTEETYIILADNMGTEEKTMIRNGKLEDMGLVLYFSTFGTDEIFSRRKS